MTDTRAGTLVISAAADEDAEAIAALIRLAFESQCELYDDWTLPPMSETAASVLDAMRSGTVLVARVDGRLVGSVRAAVRGDTVEVGRLVVDPATQGRGVGRALTLEMERIFANAQRFEIFTGHRSEVALGLYESLGYRRFRTASLCPSHDLVYLEKTRP
jgi:ribosomal protein S18 acetylase RimI-like enzyme